MKPNALPKRGSSAGSHPDVRPAARPTAILGKGSVRSLGDAELTRLHAGETVNALAAHRPGSAKSA